MILIQDSFEPRESMSEENVIAQMLLFLVSRDLMEFHTQTHTNTVNGDLFVCLIRIQTHWTCPFRAVCVSCTHLLTVTVPTVLDQLFQVIDGRYHGDALQCLTDFLIPARHLLEAVQQAACVSVRRNMTNQNTH